MGFAMAIFFTVGSFSAVIPSSSTSIGEAFGTHMADRVRLPCALLVDLCGEHRYRGAQAPLAMRDAGQRALVLLRCRWHLRQCQTSARGYQEGETSPDDRPHVQAPSDTARMVADTISARRIWVAAK